MRALAQQIQADFENYKKQAIRRQTERSRAGERGAASSSCSRCSTRSSSRSRSSRPRPTTTSARASSSCSRELLGVLEKAGVERIDADGTPFDPTEHEAVLHEDGDGEPIVARRSCGPATGSRVACCDRRW